MAFVYRRKGSRFWWTSRTDGDGVERRASTKTDVQAEAEAVANELQKEVRSRASQSGVTVEQFYETWQRLRRQLRSHSWMTDASTMAN
jgi:hypothetical protein